jgi:hypothetical protein
MRLLQGRSNHLFAGCSTKSVEKPWLFNESTFKAQLEFEMIDDALQITMSQSLLAANSLWLLRRLSSSAGATECCATCRNKRTQQNARTFRVFPDLSFMPLETYVLGTCCYLD